jgi:hypothetical protein
VQLSVSPLRMIPRAPSWEALYERYTGGPSSDGKLFLNIGRFAVHVGTGGDGELGKMDDSCVSLFDVQTHERDPIFSFHDVS